MSYLLFIKLSPKPTSSSKEASELQKELILQKETYEKQISELKNELSTREETIKNKHKKKVKK